MMKGKLLFFSTKLKCNGNERIYEKQSAFPIGFWFSGKKNGRDQKEDKKVILLILKTTIQCNSMQADWGTNLLEDGMNMKVR